jgi:hypothetical protein
MSASAASFARKYFDIRQRTAELESIYDSFSGNPLRLP